MERDARVDAYIEKSSPFAIPILKKLREMVHAYCPDVVETMKWQFPNFMYKGKILCSMASFKNHCSFGFWLASLMEKREFNREGMGHMGKIYQLEDLPDEKVFQEIIREAMGLIDAGMTIKKTAPAAKSALEIPTEITEVLKHNPAASEHFNRFSPSQRKEYCEWISEAKTTATKIKRIETMLEWVSEGKTRHWKYQRK